MNIHLHFIFLNRWDIPKMCTCKEKTSMCNGIEYNLAGPSYVRKYKNFIDMLPIMKHRTVYFKVNN